MALYNTNLTKEYGLSGGFRTAWSGVREILQNALDGHDKGHTMRLEHGKARDRSGAWALKVINEGVALDRRALVMGFSTKRGDAGQRGEHGEGLVVGLNALLNAGHEVWIRTGDEVWVPQHTRNEEGLDVLTIDIRKQNKVSQDFVVEVKGIEPDEWQAFQERLLFFGNKGDRRISFDEGTILLDPAYRNRLFVKGIYVCELPDNYRFGYDLGIHLNRDREVADPWALRSTIVALLMKALERNAFKPSEVMDVLNDEVCGESRAFSNAYFWDQSNFFNIISDEFTKTYGEDAIPVVSTGDSLQAEHYGKRGVVVSQGLAKVIEHKKGKLSDRLSREALNARKLYGVGELDANEKDNLVKAASLVSEVEEWFTLGNLTIADFVGDGVLGTFEKGTRSVRLARRILADREQTLKTLVHEVAHLYAGDASMTHEEAQHSIMARIICKHLF